MNRKALTAFGCIVLGLALAWAWRWYEAGRPPWDVEFRGRSSSWLEPQAIRDRTAKRFYRCGARELPPVRRYDIAYSNLEHISMATLEIETDSNPRTRGRWELECVGRATCPRTMIDAIDSRTIRARIHEADAQDGEASVLVACSDGAEIRRFTERSMTIYVDRPTSPAPPSVR